MIQNPAEIPRISQTGPAKIDYLNGRESVPSVGAIGLLISVRDGGHYPGLGIFEVQ